MKRLVRCSCYVAWAIICLFIASRIHAADGVRAKRVLIISTGSRFGPGFGLFEQNFVETLGQRAPARIEFYSEFLDIVRFPSQSYQRLFHDLLHEKYADQSPDLIVLNSVGNFVVAEKFLRQLFPGVRVFLAGLTEEEVPAAQFGNEVGGLVQRTDLRGTIDLILRLQPETRRVVVIGGTAEIDRITLSRAQAAAGSFTDRVKFDFWSDRSMAEVRQAVKALPPQTAILLTRMYRDAAGEAFIPLQAAQLIAEAANVPLYVLGAGSVGGGAVGGSVTDAATLGKKTGELASRILYGGSSASIPLIVRAEGVPMFDWRALKRWGISESRLPPNSVVRFHSLSVWELYKWYIIGALIIIAIQAGMIVALLFHRARRRRVEGELRESQQLMELAASAGEFGMWARDLKEGNVWANVSLRSMFGFGQKDALGLNDLISRIHPDDSARMIAAVQSAEESGLPFEGEFRAVLPDGGERWLLAKGRNVADPRLGGNLRRSGVVIDITERKHSEEALRESEDRFRTMANTAPVMIWMSGTDKLCTFFNKGWLDFTGHTLEQEIGNGWAEGVHREDLDRCLEVYGNSFNMRQEFTMEYRLRRRDGEYCWVLDHGVPRLAADGRFLGYIGSCIDITERKRAEEALKKERAFLRHVIDINPNFIFAKDREGRFTLVNQAVAEAYGTTVENLIGKTDADFNTNRDEVEFFRRMDLEVMDTLQERFIPEEHITDARGKVRWLQTVKRPIVGGDGSANQILAAASDITQRKEAEAEIQRNRQQLAHVTRISTMGELATSLAHELNQPLTAILSNAQAAQRFLSADPADLEEVRDVLKDIVQDNSRASEVIRRLWALVKKEELAFVRLDLPGVIRDVVALVHSDAILHSVRILLEFKPGLPPVRGDRVQLQQVLLNLLLNAFDAMKGCPVNEREVLVRAELDGAEILKVSVRDGGMGLTSENIFQPFYTTKREGLGMGLSISRSIIEVHGGRLWAEDNPDRGATFYFTVPIEKIVEGQEMRDEIPQ